MLNNTNVKSRGFTIVELLIVIVVIAILAAISIVAYNGIQERARNTTSADTAAQLKTKIEAWNAVNGEYPTVSDINTGLTDATEPIATEAKIDSGLLNKIQTGAGAVDQNKTAKVAPCPATGPLTGIQITYWQSASVGNKTINLGAGCS